ncbi:uncharacterized protein BDZ99DRAFT_401589, partial [Mytilinidion resinicola]
IDGHEVSPYGVRLVRVILLSPTVFPIVFAGLMGRCFRAIGLYLSERGIEIATLEQLVGCQSMFAALERFIGLKALSFIGLPLTLVWFLSPLGGQAALRLLHTSRETIQTSGNVSYVEPDAFLDSFLMGASDMNSARSTYTSIFLSSLLSSGKYQDTPMDLWGNVKVPPLTSLPDTDLVDGWRLIDRSTNATTYSSLIGVPIANISATGTTEFNFQSRQFDINCTSNKQVNASTVNITGAETWVLQAKDAKTPCTNWPCPIILGSMDSTSSSADSVADTKITYAECVVGFNLVETSISCNGTSCRADKMRNVSEPFNTTVESQAQHQLFNSFAYLPTTDNFDVGSAGARGSTNMEKWMANPNDFIGATYVYVDLWRLSPDVLGQRLEILVNTFWQSTFATTALSGKLPSNLTSLQYSSQGGEESQLYPALFFNTSAALLTHETPEKYQCDWAWMVSLLVCSTILQVAALAGLVLRYMTLAPDILGYVSSHTFLNPYLPVPTGGTTLSGLERTALLKGTHVKIGDVCSNSSVGAIAIGSAENGNLGRLSRSRWYI